MNNKKKALTTISIGAVVVVMFMCWQLFEQIVLISIDDAMYAGFTQHGLKFFIEKNMWHYMNFNGRFFVHLVMQLVVFFEEHLYAVLFPIFVTATTYIFTLKTNPEWSIYKRLFASALTLILYISLGCIYLTNVMWIAGGFNYIFPLFVVAIFYFLFLKHKNNTKAMWWLLPFAFICGATTEQYGMYTIGLITMTYFFDVIDNKKIDKRGFAYLGSAVIGLLTILLAPPTLNRMSKLTGVAEGVSFGEGLMNNWDYLGGAYALKIAPLLFMLFMAWFACCKKVVVDEKGDKTKQWRYSPLLMLGFPFTAITYGCYMVGNYVVPLIIFFVYMSIVIITMLSKKETRTLGTILLCGFGTFFMMSITSVIGYRTCIPFILSCIIVIAVMLIETVAEANKKVVSGCILAILILNFWVDYYDLYANYQKQNSLSQELYDQMMASSETGYIKFNWDETVAAKNGVNYRYTTLIDGSQLIYFQDKFGIPDDVKYFITSEEYTVFNVCYDGVYSQKPAILQDGKLYVPSQIPCLQLIKEKHIFSKVKTDEEKNLAHITVGDYELTCALDDVLKFGHVVLVNVDVICKEWDLEYTFDPDENTYRFTKSN